MALDEALRGIPGVQVDNRFNYALGERISMRSAGARAQFGVRGVRIVIDGIPATLPDGQTALNVVDLATLERIEVIRGPVASLYGNAAGGAILLETMRAPAASPVAGRAAVTAGSDGFLRTAAGAGGSSGRFAYETRLSRVAYDGFRTHSAAESRYAAAHVAFAGNRATVRATFNAVDYDALNPGSLSDSLLRVDRHRSFAGNVAQRTGEEGAQQQAGLQWLQGIGNGALELTTWAIGRAVDNPIPGRVVVIDRLAGGGRALARAIHGPLAWSAGIEHERQRDDRQNFLNAAGAHGDLVLDQLEHVGATGAFAQASLALHPRVTLLGGARHDRVAFRADDRFAADGRDDSGRRTLAAFSPSAGVSVDVGANVMTYASVGTAFETPTTTELANRPDGSGGFNPSLQPQRTVSVEIGARRASSTTTVALALYRTAVRDALIPFEVPDTPGRQFFRNAGRTATDGVEASVSLRPTASATIGASYSYTDARFRDYTVGTASFAHNAIPGVAPHRFDLTVSHATPLGMVAADVRHQSRTAVNDANTASSAAFTLGDVRIAGRPIPVGRMWGRVTGGVQNVAGTRYNSSVVVNAFGGRYYEPGPGRTAHIGISLEPRS